MSFVMVSPRRIFTFFSPTVVRGGREGKLGFPRREEHYFASLGDNLSNERRFRMKNQNKKELNESWNGSAEKWKTEIVSKILIIWSQTTRFCGILFFVIVVMRGD